LSFELDLAGVTKKLRKPAAWKSKHIANVRWDFKDHSCWSALTGSIARSMNLDQPSRLMGP